MNFDKTISKLNEYYNNPTIINYHIFVALLDNKIIQNNLYHFLKRLWSKIEYKLDETGSSMLSNYEEFNYNLNKLIDNKWNWYYTVGTFETPQDTIKVILKCNKNIYNKFIYITGYGNESSFEIENKNGLQYNNIKKVISACTFLNKLNQCKKCRIVSVNISTNGYCKECKNKAATIIQNQWRECISNPDYNICKKRLLQEFSNLII